MSDIIQRPTPPGAANPVEALKAAAECAVFGLRELVSACSDLPEAGAARDRARRAIEAAEAALDSFDQGFDVQPILGYIGSTGTIGAEASEGAVAVVPLSALLVESAAKDEAEKRAERLTALLDERWDDVRLIDAGPVGSAFGFNLSGGPVSYLAEYLAELLGHKGNGALSNYAEIQIRHRVLGPLTMTLQRENGKTPHALRREAEEALAAVMSDRGQSAS